MAARFSRYRDPPVALPPDAQGRSPATTPLRAQPEVTGTFRHVVAEGERLDQIAFRYYEEPTIWWRICDANTGFLSPLALLGQEPLRTARFPLRPNAGPPPDWVTVKNALAADPDLTGVEDVAADEQVYYETVVQTVDLPPLGARPVGVIEERYRRSLVVRFNQTATSIEKLLNAIKAAGLDIDAPIDVGQLGRQIVIPPLGAV